MGSPDRFMVEAGARFETYVRDAMREEGIASLTALAKEANHDRAVVYAWFRGESQPSMNSLRNIGAALHRSPEELQAVWVGDDPSKVVREAKPDPLLSALDVQTDLLREILDVLRGRANGPMSVTLQLADPSETELGVREGAERARGRRGRGGQNKPVPLRPRPPRDSGEG